MLVKFLSSKLLGSHQAIFLCLFVCLLFEPRVPAQTFTFETAIEYFLLLGCFQIPPSLMIFNTPLCHLNQILTQK